MNGFNFILQSFLIGSPSFFWVSAGQVLGPGVQQGDSALPRSPIGRLLDVAAPNHRRPRHGRSRLDGPRLGHAHQGSSTDIYTVHH